MISETYDEGTYKGYVFAPQTITPAPKVNVALVFDGRDGSKSVVASLSLEKAKILRHYLEETIKYVEERCKEAGVRAGPD